MGKSLVSCFFLTHGVELVLPSFKSWTVHKIIEYLTLRTNCLAVEKSNTGQQLTFLTHPVGEQQSTCAQLEKVG